MTQERAIEFTRIESDTAYQTVLNLRYSCWAGTLVRSGTDRDAFITRYDGVSAEHMLFGAYRDGELVASFELRFPWSRQRYETFTHAPIENVLEGLGELDLGTTVEANFLVVHPAARRDGLVLAAVWLKIRDLVLEHEREVLLFACSRRHARLYHRLGAEIRLTETRHPFTGRPDSCVLLFRRSVMMEAALPLWLANLARIQDRRPGARGVKMGSRPGALPRSRRIAMPAVPGRPVAVPLSPHV